MSEQGLWEMRASVTYAHASVTNNKIRSSRSRTAVKGSFGGDKNAAANDSQEMLCFLKDNEITYEDHEAGLKF